MDYQNRWTSIKELGAGGQGKVSLVLDKTKVNIEYTEQNLPEFIAKLAKSTKQTITESDKELFEAFKQSIFNIINTENIEYQGALKILHNPKDARDFKTLEERIKREINTLKNLSHPNIAKILDYDGENYKWYVSQYYSKGSLDTNRNLFTGDFVKSLRAIRPLVAGVAELHERGMVHRDIKPLNIFMDKSDNLILGDFGIVYFEDAQHTRLSETFGNVGSYDYMPGWAMKRKIETISPAFDVFSLGKVLWYMISGIPIFALWYHMDNGDNLEELFPNAPYIKYANDLLKKCVVEKESETINNASILLDEIDKILSIIDKNLNRHGFEPKTGDWHCQICGIGKYSLIADSMQWGFNNPITIARDGRKVDMFMCDNCGHTQLFAFKSNGQSPITPKIWEQ